MADGESRGCFKTGMWGCLALIGLGFFGMLALSGLAFVSARKAPEPTTDSVTHSLPGRAVEEDASLATAEQLEDARGTSEIPTATLLNEASTGVGTLELDLATGDFTLIPVAADQPLEVVAEYDKARYTLVEEFVEGESDTWTYRVSFHARRTFLFGGGNDNSVEIRVPKGHPLFVTGEVKMGRAELDFGGLTLLGVDLETGMGEILIDVSEPTGTSAEYFRVSGRMGALNIDRLGNASPREVDVDFRMGEASVELDGAWLVDSNVEMRCRMGECSARVPDNVFVDVRANATMGGRDVRLPDQDLVPEGAPTLTLKMSGSMGEVKVR